MNTRKLGQSDINISAIGLGTNYVGGHNLYKDIDEDIETFCWISHCGC